MAKAFDYIQVPLSVVATDLTGASIEVEGAYFRLVRLIAIGGPMKLVDIRRRIGEVTDVEHALNWRSSGVEPLLSFGWLEEWRERANSARERMSAAGRVSAEKRAKKKRKSNIRSTDVEQKLNSSSTNVEHATILSSTISIDSSGKEHAPDPSPAPEPFRPKLTMPFASEPFAEAWREFEDVCREAFAPLTPGRSKALLRQCAEWGEARAIAALKHSTAGGYKNLFEPPSGKQTPNDRHKSGVIGRNDKIETSIRS